MPFRAFFMTHLKNKFLSISAAGIDRMETLTLCRGDKKGGFRFEECKLMALSKTAFHDSLTLQQQCISGSDARKTEVK
jgi:hypothetical protein